MFTRPPFSAPHHDASKASLVGGGTGRVRPGEISRAHCGVLFLDEFPLFRADVIDALRQPLESGDITIARGEESVTCPARGMVVLACNPCPCGDYHADSRSTGAPAPRCSAVTTGRKVTGPIADRIDIARHLGRAARTTSTPRSPSHEPTAEVRARVERARERGRPTASPAQLAAQRPAPGRRWRGWPLARRGPAAGRRTSCSPGG